MAVSETTPTRTFRPLLSATLTNDTIDKLRFPLIASPKVDGIRVVCHPNLGPVTRSLKPVRNTHIRTILSHRDFSGLDGEIVCGPITAPDVFQRTTNGVMTQDGTPSFQYLVFDDIMHPELRYETRLTNVLKRIDNLSGVARAECPNIWPLEYETVNDVEDLTLAETEHLKQGFEGIMLRDPVAPYKFGRSTLKEQVLVKLKRFKDAEATITGFEPLLSNQNPQTRDLLGLAQRSDHKAGKVEVQTLGKLVVVHDGGFGDFAIGSGFDQTLRQLIWDNQADYIGKQIKFKYQEIGIKDKPRFPIFLGFKGDE